MPGFVSFKQPSHRCTWWKGKHLNPSNSAHLPKSRALISWGFFLKKGILRCVLWFKYATSFYTRLSPIEENTATKIKVIIAVYRGKIRGSGSHHYPFLSVCGANLSEDNTIHARLLLHLSGSESEKGHLWPPGSFQIWGILKHQQSAQNINLLPLCMKNREARIDKNHWCFWNQKSSGLQRHRNLNLASQDLHPPPVVLLAS